MKDLAGLLAERIVTDATNQINFRTQSCGMTGKVRRSTTKATTAGQEIPEYLPEAGDSRPRRTGNKRLVAQSLYPSSSPRYLAFPGVRYPTRVNPGIDRPW